MDSSTVTLGRWVRACVLAETVGMTAASGAAKWVQALSDRQGLAGSAAVALGLVVAGGLVEGTALGAFQGRVLAARWPALRRGRYLGITVLVAGVGWAAGSAPGVLSAGDSGSAEPPLALVLLGGAGIGLVMGPLLGAAQAWALRGAVRHPWRWVTANLVAWPPAMAAIFYGASRPQEDWSVPAVLVTGAATGVVAGALLGWLTGLWLASLDGQPMQNRVVLHLLQRRRLGLGRSVVGLAVRGRRSGVVRRFPAQYAADEAGLVVVPGDAERKTWWRNLRGGPTPVEVLADGRWTAAHATIVWPQDPGYAQAVTTYRARWPRVRLPDDQPIVRVALAPVGASLGRGEGLAARGGNEGESDGVPR